MNMLRIPKIIHQTWKDNNLPESFRRLSSSWKVMLPDWEYHLWTDDMNRDFVHTHYPEFLDKYDTYPKNIQRADAIRYLLLHTFGGLYVDMDFECLKHEFVSLLENVNFMAGKEPYAHARRFGREYIICNALMASVPSHPFLKCVIQRMMNHPQGWIVRHGRDILDSTGPFLLTDVYRDYPQKDGLRILEPENLYPIMLGEAYHLRQGQMPEEMRHRIHSAYAVHYFLGTWWNS